MSRVNFDPQTRREALFEPCIGGKEEGFAAEFFLMEYVPGEKLDEIVYDIKKGTGLPFKEAKVIKIFLQVAHLGSLIEKADEIPFWSADKLTMVQDLGKTESNYMMRET